MRGAIVQDAVKITKRKGHFFIYKLFNRFCKNEVLILITFRLIEFTVIKIQSMVFLKLNFKPYFKQDKIIKWSLLIITKH